MTKARGHTEAPPSWRTGVEGALAELAAGRMVVVCDDRDSAGEGGLLVAAEYAGPDEINFMTKEARGLIHLALTRERADELGLPPIPTRGRSRLGDSAMVSIEARDGVTTGISAADRARTIAVAMDPASGPEDLVHPGHVFPLCPRPDAGGRRSWVGAALELAAAAGCRPAAVVCQALRDDGDVARERDLECLAQDHDLPIVSVSELLAQAPGGEDPAAYPDAARRMREVMGHFATGVTVVTARDAEGSPVGTTANAISSVSLRPPLLLACLAVDSETLAAIRATGSFAVNVLGERQRDHSGRFAAKGADARAHEVSFEGHPLGVPILRESLATIACEVEAIHPAGDHEIVVGRVRSSDHSAEPLVEPLLFYRGSYSRLASQEGAAAPTTAALALGAW
jgi:3,4-dihydroxy-2-butanone 4-phosphate synthase